MDHDQKYAQEIIDGTAEHRTHRHPLRIAPTQEKQMVEAKPRQSTLWHMKHKPYGIGGDAIEQTNSERLHRCMSAD